MAKQGESAGKRGPVEAAALFPRLHVSHAKRDNGPRPPPRNKMALYEQVTLQASHPKAAGASGASAPTSQDEGPGGSGMQAPKARTQPDGNLPSMSSYGSRYDYPQHSMPHPPHLPQTSFSSAPSYYPQNTFQSRSMTGSQGTALSLRLPSGASSVGSASEWDPSEAQALPAASHLSQIVPGPPLGRQQSEGPSRPRQGEEEGCIVPSFQTQAHLVPIPQARANPGTSAAHDASGRWAWWSWQQQQASFRAQRPQEGLSEFEEQSRQRRVGPVSLRAPAYSGPKPAESAYAPTEQDRKMPEAVWKGAAGEEGLRAQRLALQKQAAEDWRMAAEASGRQLEVAAQQTEASQHQAQLDCKGVAEEVLFAAERRAGAVAAQQEVAAQIKAAMGSHSEGEKQGLVPVLDAGGSEGLPKRPPGKPTLNIEVPELSTQAELDGAVAGEPEGSITQEVASGLSEPAVARAAPSVNMSSGGGAAKQRPPKPRSEGTYGFVRHFQSCVQPVSLKGNGDSSPEVIEGSEGGGAAGFKDAGASQRAGFQVGKRAEGTEGPGQGHAKGRKRASAQANRATQEAAAAVAAKAGPSPSGSSSGDRSGGAGDGDPPSVCDVESNGADSAAAAAGILPKDVVSVIGQHGFWKSRKAMQQQQKKFSAQLFEMHRLVKVQKMFAENPDFTTEQPPPLTSTKRLHPRDSRWPEPSTAVTPERSAVSDVRRNPFSIPQNSGSVSHADAFKAAKTSEFGNPSSTRYVASKVAQISTQYGPREAVMAAQEAARRSFQEVSSATVAPVNVQAAEALALVAQRVGESCSKLMAHRAESEKSGGQAVSAEDSGAQVVLEEATRLSATLEAMRPHLQGNTAPAMPNPWLQNALAGAYGAYYPQMTAFSNPYLNPAMYMRQAQSMMAGYPSYDSASASFFGGEAMSAPAGGGPYGSAAGGYMPMYPKYSELQGAAGLNPALNPWMQNPDPVTAAWLATMAGGGVAPWNLPNNANHPAGFTNPQSGFPGGANPMGPTPSHSSQSAMPVQSSWANFRGPEEYSSGAGDAFAYDQFRPRSSAGRDGPTQSFSGLSHSWAGGMPQGGAASTRLNFASQSSDAHGESRQGDWSEQTFSAGGGDGMLGKRKEVDAHPRWSGWPQRQDSRGTAEDSFQHGGRSEMTHAGSFFSQSHRIKGGGNDSDEDALRAGRLPGSQFYSSPDFSDQGGAGDGGKEVNELQLFPVKSDAEKKRGAAAPIKVVPRAASETPDLGVSILKSIQRER
ncbi:protein EARLY FLOWERING 3 [Klebsormidium nitens]|uniref:Protein EARLY FLOWERING 3 n=1 Tax=Klebsormidium nitens TaxID=105231 RepID=A0A1Y1I9Z6_KLENI|nr:protein EARLY FLOWERING 3 [Klebsormidium nitens]|eukprot:GAQ85537.1 protein EARLY FLOWERING 3 [Klebsormidium nitens]